MICEVCKKKQSGMINSYPLNAEHQDIQICADCQTKLEKIRNAQNLELANQSASEFLKDIPVGDLPPFIRDQLKQEISKYASSDIVESFFSMKETPTLSQTTNNDVICPYCEKAIPADSKSCPYCGRTLMAEKRVCHHCGTTAENNFDYCNNCGARLGTYEKPMISSSGAKIFTWVLFVLLLVAGVVIGASGTYVYDTESFLNDGYVWTFNFIGMLYLWGVAIIEVFIGAIFSSILYHLERAK